MNKNFDNLSRELKNKDDKLNDYKNINKELEKLVKDLEKQMKKLKDDIIVL